MSYNDDEEVVVETPEDDDLELDPAMHEPLDDDILGDDDDTTEGFADLDGSEY